MNNAIRRRRRASSGASENSPLLESGGGRGGDDGEHAAGAKLNVFRSVAISGNDIASSILYTAGVCSFFSGRFAPLSLLMVVGVLYVFRFIYAEAITALPLNGGTYTLMLNTVSKRFAAVAACLTLLSYTATCVVSASSAAHYFVALVPAAEAYMLELVIGVILVFAVLSLFGLRDSSTVAAVIFVLHLATLTTLVGVSFTVAALDHFKQLRENITRPEASWPELRDGVAHSSLFLGFAAGCLGVTGFETAANFIEEQKRGVFVPTLKWLWIVVAVYNPVSGLAGKSR